MKASAKHRIILLFECSKGAENAEVIRLPVYCKLYEAFEKGVKRVSDKIKVGGPALARYNNFLGGFLDYVKKNGLKLDYIALFHYTLI